MTNEEAIQYIRSIINEISDQETEIPVCYVTDIFKEPLEMAIKALEERTRTHASDSSEHETHEERTDGDCISREAAFNAINEIKIRRNATWYELYRKVLEVIGGLPPFNPAKVGHWIEHEWAQELDGEGYLISNFECDKCHAWAGADYDYCPNCGVKMEVENDRES